MPVPAMLITCRNDFLPDHVGTNPLSMKAQLLQKVDTSLDQYQAEHHGRNPLYILVSPDEVNGLLEAVKRAGNHSADITVTTYRGSKIMRYEALNKGDLLLTDELPETSS